MLILVTRYSLKRKAKKEAGESGVSGEETVKSFLHTQPSSKWHRESLNPRDSVDSDPERDFSIETGFRPSQNQENAYDFYE